MSNLIFFHRELLVTVSNCFFSLLLSPKFRCSLSKAKSQVDKRIWNYRRQALHDYFLNAPTMHKGSIFVYLATLYVQFYPKYI